MRIDGLLSAGAVGGDRPDGEVALCRTVGVCNQTTTPALVCVAVFVLLQANRHCFEQRPGRTGSGCPTRIPTPAGAQVLGERLWFLENGRTPRRLGADGLAAHPDRAADLRAISDQRLEPLDLRCAAGPRLGGGTVSGTDVSAARRRQRRAGGRRGVCADDHPAAMARMALRPRRGSLARQWTLLSAQPGS